MLRKKVAVQASFIKRSVQSGSNHLCCPPLRTYGLFIPPSSSSTPLPLQSNAARPKVEGIQSKTSNLFNRWLDCPIHTSSLSYCATPRDHQMQQWYTTASIHLTLHPFSSFLPEELKKKKKKKKKINVSSTKRCGSRLSSLCPLCSRGYATVKKAPQKDQSQAPFTSEEVEGLISILMDERKTESLFDDNGILQNRSALAEELFEKGVLPEAISFIELQGRFKDALSESGKIVFYPTVTTSKVFTNISKRSKTYLTSQKGIGKSMSVALFVILKRMLPKTRVIYINNPHNIIGNLRTLEDELTIAFGEELGKNPKLKNNLKKLFASENSPEYISGRFGAFCRELTEILERSHIKLFIIIDQVNLFDNLKTSTNQNFQAAYSLYLALRTFGYRNTTKMLVSSATNEPMTLAVDQDFPEVTLFPEYPSRGLAKKFIAERFRVDIAHPIVEKLYEATAGYFLLVYECSLLLPDFELRGLFNESNSEALNSFLEGLKRYKIMEIKTSMQRFMSGNQARKEAMLTVFRALHSNLNFPYQEKCNMISRGLNLSIVDRRHIVFNPQIPCVSPLHPLVFEALKELFIDVNIVKEMLQLFAHNRSVIGFLFEHLIRQHIKDPNSASKLALISLKSPEKPAQQISSIWRNKFEITEAKFNLLDVGIYEPKSSNFPVFDLFILTPTEIYAIQITTKVTSNRVAKFVSAHQLLKEETQQPQQPNNDDEDDTKRTKNQINVIIQAHDDENNKEKTQGEKTKGKKTATIKERSLKMLRKTYNYAESSKRALKIVLISINQDPRKEELFEPFAKENVEQEHFHADAVSFLKDLQFSGDEILRMSKGEEREDI